MWIVTCTRFNAIYCTAKTEQQSRAREKRIAHQIHVMLSALVWMSRIGIGRAQLDFRIHFTFYLWNQTNEQPTDKTFACVPYTYTMIENVFAAFFSLPRLQKSVCKYARSVRSKHVLYTAINCLQIHLVASFNETKLNAPFFLLLFCTFNENFREFLKKCMPELNCKWVTIRLKRRQRCSTFVNTEYV